MYRRSWLPNFIFIPVILLSATLPVSAAELPPGAAPSAGTVSPVRYEGGLLSVEAADMEVRELLAAVSEKLAIPVEVDPTVRGKVTLRFEALPPEEAVGKILKAVGADNTLTEFRREAGASGAQDRVTRVVILKKREGDLAAYAEALHLIELIRRRLSILETGGVDPRVRLTELANTVLPLILDAFRFEGG